MKKILSFSLILTLTSPLFLPLEKVLAQVSEKLLYSELAQRRGGGGSRSGSVNRSQPRSSGASRSNTNRGQNVNRSQVGTSGSGRVNQPTTRPNNNVNRTNTNNVNRANTNTNRTNTNNNVNRTNTNINRTNTNNTNNVNRDVNRNVNRDVNQNIDRSIDRDYTNRVNRNVVNTGNRNVVVNPRSGWNNWGWNGNRPWAPNYNYWGGGFWGGVAAGAITTGITSAIINSDNDDDNYSQPTYIVIEQNSPGFQMFSSYGLTQVQCIEDGTQVYIYGPQNALMCARPNSLVSPGYYDVDPEGLVLIAR